MPAAPHFRPSRRPSGNAPVFGFFVAIKINLLIQQRRPLRLAALYVLSKANPSARCLRSVVCLFSTRTFDLRTFDLISSYLSLGKITVAE